MYTHAGAGWSIRPFTRNDRIACLHIFRDSVRAFPWRGDWQAYLPVLQNAFASARVLVAQEPSAGVIGFLTFKMATGYVDHLFVHDDWRLCGVGRGLLEVARQETGTPLSLDVDMQNVSARKAYEALGWNVGAKTGKAKADQIRLIGP